MRPGQGGARSQSRYEIARTHDTRPAKKHERMRFVFIQANHTFADALLLTDSAIIRRRPRGTIRRSIQQSDINLQPLPRGGSAGGFLIVKQKGAAPDTLYDDLSGQEALRLASEFTTWGRAQKARHPSPR